MTFIKGGYALNPGESLEDLNMGGGSKLSLKVTGEQSNGSVTVLEGIVLEGGPPLHIHDDEDEIVIIMEGELTYQVGEKKGVVRTGGILWFPKGIPHAVANHSGKPCRFVTVATPAGIEKLFKEQRDYIVSLPEGILPSPEALANLPSAKTRKAVGPPLSKHTHDK